jgi:dihydroorotate dehydrogenase
LADYGYGTAADAAFTSLARYASRETRLALGPSNSAQALLEPRDSQPAPQRTTCVVDAGQARAARGTVGQNACKHPPPAMAIVPYALTRPFLFGLDAEAAHDLTLAAIARLQNTPAQCLWQGARIDDPVTLAGLRFPNRVGLAAGLDKNGRCIDGLGAMGFGFIEVGTVTPKPQPGNPKPRIFRLPEKQALINRLGFNNEGLAAFIANVQCARRFRQAGGILGLNIGKNAATPIERAADDYLIGLEGVFAHADYVAVNISSPNTKNLRELQGDAALDALLGALQQRRLQLQKEAKRKVPMFVKIAPDLDEAQIGAIADTLQRHRIDGVIATNTTLERSAVQGLPHAAEAGGLSGAPVLQASNRVIRQLRAALGKRCPIIGVGGVMSADDARSKITAGADLVQIYTGLIYKGPGLVSEVATALKRPAG